MRKLFWKFVKRLILRDWGYCEEREEKCLACEASEVVDWIDKRIINE